MRNHALSKPEDSYARIAARYGLSLITVKRYCADLGRAKIPSAVHRKASLTQDDFWLRVDRTSGPCWPFFVYRVLLTSGHHVWTTTRINADAVSMVEAVWGPGHVLQMERQHRETDANVVYASKHWRDYLLNQKSENRPHLAKYVAKRCKALAVEIALHKRFFSPRKLDEKQAREIVRMVKRGDQSAASVARLFRVYPATVRRLIPRA